MKAKKSEKIVIFSFISVTFVFLFIFFTKINPIVVFDTDDWLYIYYTRPAIPLWEDWNPSRIFPEILMRISSAFGVYIINLFLNNYILSITVGFAIFVSVFICIYLFRLICFLKERVISSISFVISISAIFFLLHFLVFRNNYADNEYLFRANDATCYFYYIIPALLNASVVLYFLEKNCYSFNSFKSNIHIGILIVCIYFSIFSNLFQSSIIMSLFSFIIVKELFFDRYCSVILRVKKISIPIMGCVLWIISMIFEINGKRAKSDLNNFDFLGTIKRLYSTIVYEFNVFFIVLFVFITIVSIILILKKRKKGEIKTFLNYILFCLYCIIFSSIINILLCAKVGKQYIQRSDVLICVFFFVFLLISVLISLINNFVSIKIIMPLLVMIIFSFVFTGARTFKESNYINLEAERCIQIDNYLINQIKQAESNGLSEVNLHVPVFKTADNWPITDYGVYRISEALYVHHIINHKIDINFYPDKLVNKKFGLETP